MSGGNSASSQIGAKSVNGSYLSLRRCGSTTNEGEIIKRVLPSGSARDAYSVAISVPAPGRLSTTMVGPPALPICSASRRAIASAGPPGANGKTTLIGLALCDQASMAGSATRAAATSTTVAKFRNLQRGSFMVMPREFEHLPRQAINHNEQPLECPLLAQSRHPASEFRCPLLGVKRTSVATSPMSAFDPKRTLAVKICCDAQADHHARMQWHVTLGLGATHVAAGIRYTSRWHRGGVAARCPRASS